MNFIIRKANQYDMSDVLSLIKELALFEKEPDEVEISQDDLVKDGFGKKKSFKCFCHEINFFIQSGNLKSLIFNFDPILCAQAKPLKATAFKPCPGKHESPTQ